MNFAQRLKEIFADIRTTPHGRTCRTGKNVELNTPTCLRFPGNVIQVPIVGYELVRNYLAWTALVVEWLSSNTERPYQECKSLAILVLEHAPILLSEEACEPFITVLIGSAAKQPKGDNMAKTSSGLPITAAYVFARTRFILEEYQSSEDVPETWYVLETRSITDSALKTALMRDGLVALIENDKTMEEKIKTVPDEEVMRLICDGLRVPRGPIEQIRELAGYPEPPRNEEGILVLKDEEMVAIETNFGTLVWTIMSPQPFSRGGKIDAAPAIAKGVIPIVPTEVSHIIKCITIQLENIF